MIHKQIVAIAGAIALLGATPCGGPESVTAAYTAWTAAFAKHDLEATMAFFDPNVVMSFAGAPDARYVALRDEYAREFSRASADRWIPTFEPPMVDGGVAVAVSRWRLVRDGRDMVRNRGVDVLRCERGAWRVVRSFNYTEWERKKS